MLLGMRVDRAIWSVSSKLENMHITHRFYFYINFKAVVFNRGDLITRGHLSVPGGIFGCHAWGLLLASNG